MSEKLTEKGLAVFGELMGEAAREAMASGLESRGFGGDIGELACQFAFGSIWARDGLERKQRSLVVLGVLIAQRQAGELRNHVRIALNNGLTPREIEVRQGETIRFIHHNSGKVMHEFVLGTRKELEEHAELMKKFPDM
ncbi:MAG: carboxymuconolactone decarboxylase family protein, partial [Novosphingobium sp.]|nr:carboxymuconolactone decarboxylase family protein [Novosphingobium sp.]